MTSPLAGRSLEEVKAELLAAILSYIEDAKALEPSARDRLLNRRMPLRLQAMWQLKVFLHILGIHGKADDGRFELPCPA